MGQPQVPTGARCRSPLPLSRCRSPLPLSHCCISESISVSPRQVMASLYQRVTLPQGDSGRFGLPDSCDRRWFSSTYCAGKNLSDLRLEDPEGIWPHISVVELNYPLALVAALPSTVESFLNVDVKEVEGVEHLVVGTASNPGAICTKCSRHRLHFCLHYRPHTATLTTAHTTLPTPHSSAHTIATANHCRRSLLQGCATRITSAVSSWMHSLTLWARLCTTHSDRGMATTLLRLRETRERGGRGGGQATCP